MNTPTHLVLNVAMLGRGHSGRRVWPAAIGAVFPDLPLFAFWAYQRFWVGATEQTIWSELYFRTDWQALFDAVHSIPLIAIGLVLAAALHRSGWVLFFASMLLHALCDLPLHTHDAHRHFFPFSDYRFVSPVSYWDPHAHGTAAALVELLLVGIASLIVARRTTNRLTRGALLGFNAIAATGYVLLYWMPH
jgi:hypothetical protein